MDSHTSERIGALETASAPPPDSSAEKATAAADSPTDETLILIESEEAGVQLNLRELLAYRELLYFLTWRDIKVRYKQTFMGVLWVIIQPLAAMLLFTAVFHRLGGFGGDGMPYPLFAYAGLLLWMFFAGAVNNSTNSLISNTNLITKVYFPRVFIPAAAVAAGLLDLAVASVLLFGLAFYYGLAFTWSMLLLPGFIALMVLLALGVGLLIAALTVQYRDLRHALPFLIQLWMFASPIIYPASIVPERWRWLLALNPVAGIVEGFRAALTGRALDWPMISVAAALTFLLLAGAFYLFRRIEDTFADVI